MRFERGKDPKETMNIGATQYSIEISRVIGTKINDTDTGLCADYLTEEKSHRILEECTKRDILYAYYVTVPHEAKAHIPIDKYRGKLLRYNGKYYKMIE